MVKAMWIRQQALIARVKGGFGKMKGCGKSQGVGKGKHKGKQGKGKGVSQAKGVSRDQDVAAIINPVINLGPPRVPGAVRRALVGGGSASTLADNTLPPLPPPPISPPTSPDFNDIPLPKFGGVPIVADPAEAERDTSGVTLRSGKGRGQQLAQMTPVREPAPQQPPPVTPPVIPIREPSPVPTVRDRSPSRSPSRTPSRSRSRQSRSRSRSSGRSSSASAEHGAEQGAVQANGANQEGRAPPQALNNTPVYPYVPGPPVGIHQVLGENHVFYTLQGIPFDQMQLLQIQRVCQILYGVTLKPNITRMEVGYLIAHLMSLAHTPPASVFGNAPTHM